MQDLTPKERFDACMKIADFATGRMDARRQYEWRFAFGIWAFLALAIAYVQATKFPFWIGIPITIIHGSWLHGFHQRSTTDVKIAWSAVYSALDILRYHRVIISIQTPKFVKSSNKKIFGFLGDWSMGVHFFITVGLVALFYYTRVDHVTYGTIEGFKIGR